MLNKYINGSSYFECPSFSVIVFTMLLTLLLSVVIAQTYKLVIQAGQFPKKFFQAMMLISTIAAIVMMLVGDHLMVGFGVLTVFFMISFRTLFHNSHNIIFILAALSVGIATGESSYVIAISGTIIFCFIVVLLYYTPVESD